MGLAEGGIKQVLILRTDLDMGRGKLVAQGAHASLMSYLEASRKDKSVADSWIRSGEKKIVLKVNSEEALKKLYEAFKYKEIPCALVSDRGLTQLPPNTKTALGIGPWKGSEIDKLTIALKLL